MAVVAMTEPPYTITPLSSPNSHHNSLKLVLLHRFPQAKPSFVSIRPLTLRPCSCLAENVDPSPLLPSSALLEPPSSSLNSEISLDSSTTDRRKVVRVAWEKLVRWSRSLRSKAKTDVLERTNKVVVLGGGSFGTAMAAHVAGRKAELEVNMLVRDRRVCQSINERHCNF